MRTTVTIPEATFKELLRYSHADKPSEAINLAIREWVRMAKIAEIKKLQGKVSIEDNLRALRNKETKKIRKLNEKSND